MVRREPLLKTVAIGHVGFDAKQTVADSVLQNDLVQEIPAEVVNLRGLHDSKGVAAPALLGKGIVLDLDDVVPFPDQEVADNHHDRHAAVDTKHTQGFTLGNQTILHQVHHQISFLIFQAVP